MDNTGKIGNNIEQKWMYIIVASLCIFKMFEKRHCQMAAFHIDLIVFVFLKRIFYHDNLIK